MLFFQKTTKVITIFLVALFVMIQATSGYVYATEVQTEERAQESEENNETEAEENAEEESATPINEYPDWPVGPEVDAPAAVVLDYYTGTVLYEKNPTTAHYPASITKVMTALVALENSELDEIVTFSAEAVYGIERDSSHISRDVGEEMTMEQCLYGLMLESANECGNAIAEHVGGSVEEFANMMNAKAAELGCQNTHFVNPHGLHDDDHYTCAGDMALIARAAYQNPVFAMIVGTRNYKLPPTNKHTEETPLNNHHAMFNAYRTNQYLYENCIGGKTGYTTVANATLVTYAQKDGKLLVCVAMNSSSKNIYATTKTLFEYFFNRTQAIKISELKEDYSTLLATSISSLMDDGEVPFSIDMDTTVLVPNNADLNQITAEYVMTDDGAENEVGVIRFSYGGRNVGNAPIIGRTFEGYQFLNSTEGPLVEGEKFIVVNIYRVLLIVLGSIAAIIVAVIGFLKTNNAFAVYSRKKRENRDPHKNLKQIRRNRNRRAGRGKKIIRRR